MTEIVYYIYIFHLTWPMPLHYLVKSGCSNFLPNTGFVTIRLFRFGVRVKRACCRDNFLAQRPLSDMRRLSGDFYVSTGRHPGAFSTRHRRFPKARETCEKKHVVIGACVRVRGAHFEHEFWQFWANLSWQLITLLNKPYSVYCVLIQSSDTLLQIIQSNVM